MSRDQTHTNNNHLLNFYYQMRKEIAKQTQTDEKFIRRAFKPYLNLAKYKKIWSKDQSISAIVKLCHQQPQELDIPDELVTKYSKIFNKILSSDRNLLMCYDCGTMARANFMALIKAHRHDEGPTPLEQIKLKQQYFQSVRPINRLKQLNDYLTNPSSPTGALMCSIGLGDLGHVFVLELQQPGNKIRLFQSAHMAYTTVDYLDYVNMLANPQTCTDWPQLYADLCRLFKLKNKQWTEAQTQLFNSHFHFLDYNPKPNIIRFGWCSLAY